VVEARVTTTAKSVKARSLQLISFTVDDFLRAASFTSGLTTLVQDAPRDGHGSTVLPTGTVRLAHRAVRRHQALRLRVIPWPEIQQDGTCDDAGGDCRSAGQGRITLVEQHSVNHYRYPHD
jgi:hypothetical protein